MSGEDFKYGWCYTDHKDGREIRGGHWRKTDYMLDKSTAKFVKDTLESYGLPQPDIDTEVFRGTNHDLLFLDSHGIVIRIGVTNVEELVNPAIIQPLHWTDDPNSDITIALYPGIHIFKDEDFHNNYLGSTDDMRNAIKFFGNSTTDADDYNAGFIPVISDTNEEGLVPILLDADSSMQQSREAKPALSKTKEAATNHLNATHSLAIKSVYSEAMNAFNGTLNTGLFLKAFEYHQPLRRAFERAFKNEKPNKKALSQAWEMAKNYHDQGYQIWRRPPSLVTQSKSEKESLIQLIRSKLGVQKITKPKKNPPRIAVEKRHLLTPWGISGGLEEGKVPLDKIPPDQFTNDICIKRLKTIAEQEGGECGEEFALIPKEKLNEELCMVAVQLNEYSHEILLEAIPDAFKTEKFWLSALAHRPEYLEHLPHQHHSLELYEELLANKPSLIEYCKPDLLTQDLCDRAVNLRSFNLKYIPNKFKTPDMCETIFAQSPGFIAFFPPQEITEERLQTVLERNPKAIFEIQVKEQVPRHIWAAAFSRHVTDYKTLPEAYKTDPLFAQEVAELLNYTEPEQITSLHDIILDQGDINAMNLIIIDDQVPDEILPKYIEREPRLIRGMPHKPEREYLYKKAHELDPNAIRGITREKLPKELKTRGTLPTAWKNDQTASTRPKP